MSLETFGYIKDLVAANPAGSDAKSQGDNHLRGIKQTLQNQFPGFTEGAGITATESQLNKAGKHADDYVSVKDFGAVGDGVANDTTALLNFFNHCINTGTPGHISAGTYLVTAGVLAFDNGFVDKAWPNITTDGYDRVKFLRADATDAPMITLSNGTATSGAGNYWNGGSLGGITFDQNGKAPGSSQHGISLRGVYGINFGWIRADDQGGSCVYVPQALYGGNNPDPYAVTFCNFEAVEANRCRRYALENQNWVGLNGCVIGRLRVIECLLGGFYGIGAGNVVEAASMGSVKGWAFDDGTATANTGGSPSRFYINFAELDDVQNGIRLNKTQISTLDGIRFVHRYNFNPLLNPGEGYWPRTAISVGGGTGPSIAQITANVIHRIEAGGTKPALGIFVNMHSVGGNILSTNIDQRILDNAGFGFVGSDLFAGVTSSTQALLTRDRVPINDVQVKVAALVRSSTSSTVQNSGFGGAASKITFATETYDKGNYYDPTNSWFAVPYSGLYRVTGRICLTVAVGTRVRIGFATDTAGAIDVVLNRTDYQVNAGAQHYQLDGVVSLAAGERVFLMADQNSGGVVNLSAPISAAADLTWSIEAL